MMSDILFIPLLAPPQLQNNFIMIILYSNVDCVWSISDHKIYSALFTFRSDDLKAVSL